jgi:long-chain fatty acid transport protein
MFPNLYAVKGGESKFKYGLGVYVPYGLGATWDAFNLPDSMMVAPNVFMPLTWADGFPEEEMMSSIGIVDVHPTFAYKFNDRFSIGAGLSVYYGMIEITKLQPNPDYSYYIPTTLEMEGSGLGYGANIGMMWQVSDYAKIGMSGKIPAKVNMKGDADMRIWYNNVIGMGTAIVREFNPDIEAELNLPGDIGWGLSLKATENWTINTDFSYTFWNNLDKVVITFDPAIDLAPVPVILEESELVTKWNDTYRVSLGTQYQMNKVALRGGFFYDESPVPDGTLTPTLPDTAEKYSGNFGLGWQLGSWLLDVNYEHIFFAEREIKDQTAENMAGVYNNAVNAFNFGLTYNF